MIPNYQITGQQVTPEEIVDIIPEQEASDRQVQINEEKYFQQLKAQGEEKLRSDAKLVSISLILLKSKQRTFLVRSISRFSFSFLGDNHFHLNHEF